LPKTGERMKRKVKKQEEPKAADLNEGEQKKFVRGEVEIRVLLIPTIQIRLIRRGSASTI